MLVLSRLVGQEIVIGETIRVRIAAIKGRRVQLAIEAPESISIYRQEVQNARSQYCDSACVMSKLSLIHDVPLTPGT
jgi:carbon storage regulator